MTYQVKNEQRNPLPLPAILTDDCVAVRAHMVPEEVLKEYCGQLNASNHKLEWFNVTY